ncbi:MAG: GAF domain-containing protein [Microbacteriaceae bacterium]
MSCARVMLRRLDREIDALPRPRDSTRVRVPGPDPDRVLLFGSGPLAGYGVLSHERALPGQLARQLAAATGRGARVDAVIDTAIVARDVLARLSGLELWNYDAIVLGIGGNDALLRTAAADWRRSLETLLERLDDTVPSGTGIHLLAVPPVSSVDVRPGLAGRLSDAHAIRLNAETRRVAVRHPQATYVPFSPLVKAEFDGRGMESAYRQWAGVIAAPLIRQLRGTGPAGGEDPVRSRAFDAGGTAGPEAERRFSRIAELAREMFGADQALVCFLDRDRLLLRGVARSEPSAERVLPRAGSFADWAIRRPAAFVVEDTLADPRFAQHPSVLDAQTTLRFCAAYPIESRFGERVGVISVLGRRPRVWTENESSLLRDLALLVQRELE